ncbi:hypothetical protein FAVG1_12841 [Fusarium avenaceum]|nr:hypothetical protein FAVG1_12841 [Fusarium avenaceum]
MPSRHLLSPGAEVDEGRINRRLTRRRKKMGLSPLLRPEPGLPETLPSQPPRGPTQRQRLPEHTKSVLKSPISSRPVAKARVRFESHEKEDCTDTGDQTAPHALHDDKNMDVHNMDMDGDGAFDSLAALYDTQHQQPRDTVIAAETTSQLESQADPHGSIGQALGQSANFIFDIFHSGLNLAIRALMLMQKPFKTTIGQWVLNHLMYIITAIVLFAAALLCTYMFGFNLYCYIIKYEIESAPLQFLQQAIPASMVSICTPVRAGPRNAYSSVLPRYDPINWNPQSPSIYKFLRRVFSGMENSELIMSQFTEPFRDTYKEGLDEASQLEHDFLAQQKALWNNVNHYIENFPYNEPRTSRILGYLGFVNRGLLNQARRLNLDLTSMLANAQTQTRSFRNKLYPEDIDTGVSRKLSSKETQQHKAKLERVIGMMPQSAKQGELYDQSVIWSAASEVAHDMLQNRVRMLDDDGIWLRGTVVALKGNYTKAKTYCDDRKKRVCEDFALDMVEGALGAAQVWRARLKSHIVQCGR